VICTASFLVWNSKLFLFPFCLNACSSKIYSVMVPACFIECMVASWEFLFFTFGILLLTSRVAVLNMTKKICAVQVYKGQFKYFIWFSVVNR
jgi:hypothetical protein